MSSPVLLLCKSIDKSALNAGISIPAFLHEQFYRILGFTLSPGERRDVPIILDGEEFTVRLHNNGFDREKFNGHCEQLRLLYPSASSPIAQKLRAIFRCSSEFIKSQSAEKRKRIVIPQNQREFLAIYSVPGSGILTTECIKADEAKSEAAEIMNLDESAYEAFANRTDENASIALSSKIVKIRHLDRSIGQGLKEFYEFKCQICGEQVGERYGQPVAEAHHIEYFTRSMNNDAGNILVVCPNHHRIIHCNNPKFDRRQLAYLYPNGLTERLTLNRHL